MNNNCKIILKITTFHYHSIQNILSKIIKKIKQLKIAFQGPSVLPTKIKRFTVLKSPHVNKKSRDQFEMKIYKSIIILAIPDIQKNKQLIKIFFKYIKSLCSDSDIKIIYMPGKI